MIWDHFEVEHRKPNSMDTRSPSQLESAKRFIMFKCVCGTPANLYWLRDEIWRQVESPPGNEGGLCLDCAEQRLGRELTLDDLEVENYQRTARNTGKEFMEAYVRATLIGACQAAGLVPPDGWATPVDRPYTDGMAVGARLANQTLDPESQVVNLIHEANRVFS
jgi:hypothetical protein